MQALARSACRRLDPAPGRRAFVDLEDEALRAAVESLLGSAGVEIAGADEGGPVDLAVVDVPELPGPLVPERVVSASDALRAGGRLAVVVHALPVGASTEAQAERWKPCLGLSKAHGETVGPALLLSGTKRAVPDASERKRLRGLGHALEPSVLLGRAGLSAEVVGAARRSVERHGLVKVKLTPQCELEKDAALRALASATGSVLVQRVGRMALLFRPDVPLDPPVSRAARRAR